MMLESMNWYEEERMVVDDDENQEDRGELEVLFQRQKTEALETYPQMLRTSFTRMARPVRG
jgi:hypothetical protein